MLDRVAKKTGLPKSEILRRAMVLLNREIERRGGVMKVGWIVEELGPPDCEDGHGCPPQPFAIAAETPPPYAVKKTSRRKIAAA